MVGIKKCKSYLTIASVLAIREVNNIILDDNSLCKGGQLIRFTIKRKRIGINCQLTFFFLYIY